MPGGQRATAKDDAGAGAASEQPRPPELAGWASGVGASGWAVGTACAGAGFAPLGELVCGESR